jgi:MFS family permease
MFTKSQHAAKVGAAAATNAARVGAAAASGAGRIVHRMTRASGAGRTGLSNLIELTAAGGIGDSFVAIALAGTLFFSASVEQARGRAALALLITIAPYAVLAPLIGPLLDRVKQGNRYILMGTMLARGLLCWAMAGAVEHNDAVTLLPAAFGVLVLQKAYSVTRAAVTPRLLPSEITLVTANARSNLATLLSTSAGAAVALGIDAIMGGGGGGAAWVLRIGAAIYLAAMILGFRLPSTVDVPNTKPRKRGAGTTRPAAARQVTSAAGTPEGGQAGKARRILHIIVVPRISVTVVEAMSANAAIRMFYGFMIFFLAFILRTEHFGHISDKVALGGLAASIAVGGLIGTGVGSALRSRSPQAMMFVVLGLATVTSIACAVLFGLWSILVVTLAAAISQTLVKVALDSILQREISEETRSSTFAFSETVNQLALVSGGLIGLLLSLTGSGFAGLTVAAIGLAFALCLLVLIRRRRILRARLASASNPG